MRIPADATIAAEKLTGYLLLPRQWDDKSKFLRQHLDGGVRFVTLKPRKQGRA